MAAGVRALVLVLATLGWQVYLLAASDASCSREAGDCQQDFVGESLLQKSQKRSSQVLKVQTRKKFQDLPEDLWEVGTQIFHDEQSLEKVVRESTVMNIVYAGVPISLRIFGKDNAAERLGDQTEDGQEYGFESLLNSHETQQNMVNMIDLGGNYGAVTVAVYSKYPGLMRTVVVEPIASTYFFLLWNLHLNGVPRLTPEEFIQDTSRPGVVALYGGITEKKEDINMCSHPEWSMNAKVVTNFDEGMGCDCSFMNCTKVPGITVEDLLDDYFADRKITFMKMDCEGCEFNALPALARRPDRVQHLVGELHMPEEHLIDTACQYDDGNYMTKVCRLSKEEWKSSLPLGCNQDRDDCARKDLS